MSWTTPAANLLRNYAQLTRISNLPTCLTNVLVGAALIGSEQPLPFLRLAAAAMAVFLFYAAGMALNDVVDAGIDRQTRPGRPIPSGRISRGEASGFAAISLLLGVLLLGLCGRWALGFAGALAAAIVVYNLIHKKVAWAALLMGICRGLIYPTVAAALLNGSPLDVPRSGPFSPVVVFAVAMTLYITGLTLVAQKEDRDDVGVWRRRLTVAVPLPALLAAALVYPQAWLAALIAGAIVALLSARAARWVLRRPPRVKRAVLGWLAAICMVDAFFLALLDRPGLAVVAAVAYFVTFLAHRRVLGT